MTPEPTPRAHRLPLRDGGSPEIAVLRHDGARADSPGILFCSGFHSSMQGDKARAVETWCVARGLSCTRFDYRGHGESGGDPETLTLLDWLEDALCVVDQVCDPAPLVVIGSSMGAWLAVHIALRRPARVGALLLIAAAPDFLQAHLPASLDADARARYDRDETVRLPTPEDAEGYPVSRALVASGHDLALLSGDAAADLRCPVRCLHGTADDVAPWSRAIALLDRLGSEDATLELIKGADHRLSTPEALRHLERTFDATVATLSP